MVHELPYDDPERLRARLAQPLPDRQRPGDRRRPAAQRPPAARPGPAAAGRGRRPRPHLDPLALVLRALRRRWRWILVRHNERFPRAARQMAAVFDLGCAVYFAVPTAPPWWASEQGLTGEEVRRIMVEVGEDDLGLGLAEDVRRARRQPLGGDALAALRHLAGRRRSRSPKPARSRARSAGATPATLGFALVYLGEHYVTDLLAGAALVAAVRRGEPLAEPLVHGVNRGPAAFGEDRQRVASQECLRKTRRTATAARRNAAASRRGGWSRRVVVVFLLLGGDLLPLPEAGRARRRAEQARRGRPALDRHRDRLQRRRLRDLHRPLQGGGRRRRAAADAGRRPTRSTWPGWRRRCSSRPAAPAASPSPTGRCARPGWAAATSPGGWSPSSPSTTPSTRWP